MTWHLYFLPVIGTGIEADSRRPKYIAALSGISWAAMDYGFNPSMVAAADVDDATDSSIDANADVNRIPDNMDLFLSAGAVSVVQNAMEVMFWPADWVNTTYTYRQILRYVGGFCAYLQRYSAISGNINPVFSSGNVTLSTQFNQLPAKARQDLQATATDLGLSYAGITGTMTMRQIMKSMADQWGQRSFSLGGVKI